MLTIVLRQAFRGLLRDPAFVARLVLSRLRADPLGAVLVASRFAGPAGRRSLWPVARCAASAVRLLRPSATTAAVVLAVALWELGHTDAALDVMRPGHRYNERCRLHLAAFATRVDRPEIAQALLDGVANDHPKVLRERARALLREGHLTLARDCLTATSPEGRQGALNWALAHQVSAEQRVLDPGWQPGSWTGAAARPAPGRVLHMVTNSLPYKPSGYGIRTHRIVQAQLGVGLVPHVATKLGFPATQGHLGRPPAEVIDGVTYHRLIPHRIPQVADEVLAANVLAAGDLAARVRPAVLHAASNHHNARVALCLRESLGVPVVYEVRGFLEETWLQRRTAAGESDAESTERYQRTRQMETWCMQRADAVVAIAATMRDEIVARGVPAAKVIVVPNAVDDVAPASPADRAALRQRLGIAARAHVVGYISSLAGYEGVHHLIDAVRLLRDEGRDVHLLVVGDGEVRAALEQQAHAAGLKGHATFTGRVPVGHVRDYYGVVDVFVVPRVDARVTRLVTPLKPFEAMAAGVAVVVSRVPALLEIVRDGQTGLSFTPEDPDDLARVVAQLLDDDEQRAALGAAGQAWVRRERTWPAIGLLYADLYESLGVAVRRD